MLLGFSTGCLYKVNDTLSLETIKIYRSLGIKALELMAHEVEDLEKLKKINKETLNGFDFVSLHAPLYRGEHQKEQYEEFLKEVEKKSKEGIFHSVVLHPDMFSDFSFLNKFEIPYAIENMDNRKKSCKTVGDLREAFEKIDAKFVLDLNHAYSNDQSMESVEAFLREFGDKLVEIHISGFVTFHEPLFLTKQDFILEYAKQNAVPIIVESVLNSVSELKNELAYIKQRLN